VKPKRLTEAQRYKLVRKRYAKLKDLTPYKIAKFLEKKKIRGYQMEAKSCPLAVYLNYNCSVGYLWIQVGKYRINLAGNAESFIHRFDSGTYPKLIKVPKP